MVAGVSQELGDRLPHPLTGRLFQSPVPAGTGWPGDPATAETAVASDRIEVAARAAAVADLAAVDAEVSVCRACPRLVEWRETVAVEKRRSFAGEPYWGRPVAGWGDARPRVLVLGLAPAAHGGNRTGRVFTGDRSGDWLFASLHRVGLAARPDSRCAGDGQRLIGTRMVAPVRCAPPDNHPSVQERDTCSAWLDAELRFVLPTVRAVVCLGLYAWETMLRAAGRHGFEVARPRPRFGHGSRVELANPGEAQPPLVVLGCYHPSQQNTFTNKLTEPMLDAVLGEAARLGYP
jgi:uracil-DNA glycosylase family 4